MRIYGYTFAILINTHSPANDYCTAIDWLCYDITANLNMTGIMKGDQFDVLF